MADLLENLREIERSREAYWRRYPATSPTRLRWRANAARHALHIAPGELVLELGAGSGIWTQHLAEALRHESPITAAAFNEDLAEQACARKLANVEVAVISSREQLASDSFDFVVGTAMLSWPAPAFRSTTSERVVDVVRGR